MPIVGAPKGAHRHTKSSTALHERSTQSLNKSSIVNQSAFGPKNGGGSKVATVNTSNGSMSLSKLQIKRVVERPVETKSLAQKNNIMELSAGDASVNARKNQVILTDNYRIQQEILLMKNRKMKLLASVEILTDKEKAEVRPNTPTTEAMRDSIKALAPIKIKSSKYLMGMNGHKAEDLMNNHSMITEENSHFVHSTSGLGRGSMITNESSFPNLSSFGPGDKGGGGWRGSVMKSESMEQIILPRATIMNNKIKGNRPCARDGHTGLLFEDMMIIFGGDRHTMSLNDIFSLNLDEVLRS
jgi:hypothetical protein